MKLLLLTAALASIVLANPAVGPAAVGEEVPNPANLATIGETELTSTRRGSVVQTGTLTNSGASGRDIIQYVINLNEVRIGHLWRNSEDILEDDFSHDLEYRDQTTTLTNSLAVRNSFVQYVRHDSRFRSKIAKIVDNIAKGGAGSNYQAGEDDSITNTGEVQGSYNRYSVNIDRLHMTDNDDNDDLVSNVNYGTNPVSHTRSNPVQTGTITNSGAIQRDLTQYVINMNELYIDHVGRMADAKNADIENPYKFLN